MDFECLIVGQPFRVARLFSKSKTFLFSLRNYVLQKVRAF
jgi:hypothetical protein